MNSRFVKNDKGRDFVVGDLHGCFDLFMKALEQIEFDFVNDRMFSVGDLVDRGDKNMECLRLIKEPWFHAVQGNHEDMMIKAVLHGEEAYNWEYNGGMWHVDADQAELIELVKLTNILPLSITVETDNGDIGICHAQPPSQDWNDVIDPDQRTKMIMLWSRSWIADKDMEDVEGVNMTIHGHTPINEPEQIGNVLFIDTGAVFTGNLTCMQL
jgi:serine/threonine protein phosphatase 1